jgi:hypothetical protein
VADRPGVIVGGRPLWSLWPKASANGSGFALEAIINDAKV